MKISHTHKSITRTKKAQDRATGLNESKKCIYARFRGGNSTFTNGGRGQGKISLSLIYNLPHWSFEWMT